MEKTYQIALRDGNFFVIGNVHSVAITDGSYAFYAVNYELLFAVPFNNVSYVLDFDLINRLEKQDEPLIKAEGSE